MSVTGRPARDNDRARDYPVLLDLVGRPCLVVGGGQVAARRTAGLVDAGARVTVVSPHIGPAMEAILSDDDPAVEVELRPYRAGEVAGYVLVLTATGEPDIDGAVIADAAHAGVLVAGADRGTPGSVRLPAVLRHGPVTVAVSTGASSPALSRWLRDRVATVVPTDVTVLADLLDEARRRLQASGRRTDSVDWAGVLDDQLVPLVEAGRIDEARAALARLGDPPEPTPGGGTR